MPAQVTPQQIARKFPKANLSALPTSNPGGGKPWLRGDGAIGVGAYTPAGVTWNDLAGLLPLDKLPAHTHDDRYARLSGGNTLSGNQAVTGDLTASGNIRFSASTTASTPSVRFGSDTTTGFWQPAANQIGITVQGTDVFRWAIGGIVYCFAPTFQTYGDIVFGSSGGPRLRNSSGNLLVRNNADTADGTLAAGNLSASNSAYLGPAATLRLADYVNIQSGGNWGLIDVAPMTGSQSGLMRIYNGLRDLTNYERLEVGQQTAGDAVIRTAAGGTGTRRNLTLDAPVVNVTNQLTTNRPTAASYGVYACGKNANGYVDWELNEGLIAGTYGGSLTLRAGDASNTSYFRLRYDQGYPKIETNRDNFNFTTSAGSLQFASTYISQRIGANTYYQARSDGTVANRFRNYATGQAALVAQGMVSQTGNLVEAQDSTGSAVFSVGPTGVVTSNSATGCFQIVNAAMRLFKSGALLTLANGNTSWPLQLSTNNSGVRISNAIGNIDLVNVNSTTLAFYTPVSGTSSLNATAPGGALANLASGIVRAQTQLSVGSTTSDSMGITTSGNTLVAKGYDGFNVSFGNGAGNVFTINNLANATLTGALNSRPRSATVAPNVTDIPSGFAVWWHDTVGNGRRYAYNDAGLIYQSPLLKSSIPATPSDLAGVISVLQHWGLCA